MNFESLDTATEPFPGIHEYFTDREWSESDLSSASAESLAARLAAKLAAACLLVGDRQSVLEPAMLRAVEVLTSRVGPPGLLVTTPAGDEAVGPWNVSLTHDGGLAAALVVRG